MTQMDYTRATKYFLLQDFWKAFGLTMKYFFSPNSVSDVADRLPSKVAGAQL